MVIETLKRNGVKHTFNHPIQLDVVGNDMIPRISYVAMDITHIFMPAKSLIYWALCEIDEEKPA